MNNSQQEEDLKIALTIAGSDPTGGAGMQADLRTFRAMGVHGMGVPSVLTSQNSKGVHSVHELPAGFVEEQLDILLQDIRPDALKTGMLYNSDIIKAVADRIGHYSLKNLVIDPVTVSSTGVRLIEERGLDVMNEALFSLAEVITPNIYEASLFAGMEIMDESGMKEAAVRLREFGPKVVIITGGHLEEKAGDLFFDGDEFMFLETEMLDGEFHGTGCAFSSVITAGLALGYGVKESFVKAKDFVWNAMRTSVSSGRGMKILNI